MGKVFENFFSEIQVDMIDICMEYVDYQAEKIYIYCCCEGRMIHNEYFYELDGQIVERNRVNEVSYRSTATRENADKCLDILIDDVLKLKKLCIEHGRPMPTEIKMIYDVKKILSMLSINMIINGLIIKQEHQMIFMLNGLRKLKSQRNYNYKVFFSVNNDF